MHEDLVYLKVHDFYKRCVRVALFPGPLYNKEKMELGTFYIVLDVKDRHVTMHEMHPQSLEHIIFASTYGTKTFCYDNHKSRHS